MWLSYCISLAPANNLPYPPLFHAASGEGRSSLSVPGHRGGDEKPLAQVFTCSCLLLLPGLCGGRQPRGGHQGATAVGHYQEAVPAGHLK